MNHIRTSVSDVPVLNKKDDCLKMAEFARALSTFIEQAQTPITIALQGEWGSGKTSMMNCIQTCLTEETEGSIFIPLWVNVWQHSLVQEGTLSVVAILQDIIQQIRDISPTSVKEVADRILKGTIFLSKAALSVSANVLGLKYLKVGGAGSNAARDLFQDEDTSVPKLRSEIISLIAELLKAKSSDGRQAKMVLFIDDLDRMRPEMAVQMLEVMKNLFDCENCVFVLSLDWNVVVKGLKPKFGEMTDENAHEFRDFFDKIIQLPFSMPTSAYQIDKLLQTCLERIAFLTPEQVKDPDFLQTLSDFAVCSVGTNPRAVKRLVNYLSLIKILVGTTDSEKDDELLKNHADIVFALVCLQIKYNDVYMFLERHPNFPKWDDELACRHRLPPISEEEMKYLSTTQTFDDPWEQVLYRFCKQHSSLMPFGNSISQMLNMLWNRLNCFAHADSIGRTLKEFLMISSITSIKGRQDVIGEDGEADTRRALHRMRREILELKSDRGGFIYTGLEHVDFAARHKSEFAKENDSMIEYMRVGALVKTCKDDEPEKRVALDMFIRYEEAYGNRKYVITGGAGGCDWNKSQPTKTHVFALDMNNEAIVGRLEKLARGFGGYFGERAKNAGWKIASSYQENKGFEYRLEIPCMVDVPVLEIREELQGAFDRIAIDLNSLTPYL